MLSVSKTIESITSIFTGMFQVETICSVGQDTNCYRTLGQTVLLQLTTSTDELRLFHQNQRIFTFRRSKVIFLEHIKDSVKDRWQFSPENGTLRISPAEINDSGLYEAESFDQKGKRTGRPTVQLTIEGKLETYLLSLHWYHLVYLCK